jgi:hypothetical protein
VLLPLSGGSATVGVDLKAALDLAADVVNNQTDLNTPLAKTAMLVAPTPAEYRLLGTNERLLAALRGATGGREVIDAADAWTHDLGTTTASTNMVPWLLLLALLCLLPPVLSSSLSSSLSRSLSSRSPSIDGSGAAPEPAAADDEVAGCA